MHPRHLRCARAVVAGLAAAACLAVMAGLAAAVTPAAAQALKPLIAGLIDKGPTPFTLDPSRPPDNSLRTVSAAPGVFAGVVLNFQWFALEPQRGRFDFTAVDAALDAVRAYNRRNPSTPLLAKLRVYAADNAPDWAKAIGGAPLQVAGGPRRIPYVVGRFWTPAYTAAWTELQTALADRYDADPLIAEVADASCAATTDEPFSLGVAYASAYVLHAAGFSDALYAACLDHTEDSYGAWHRTRIDMPISAFIATDSGRVTRDDGIAARIAGDWRARMGPRGILSNHALRFPPRPAFAGVIDALRAAGPPIEFQTQTPNDLGDVDAAMRLAISLHATAIELWSPGRMGGWTTMSATDLQTWSAALRANARMLPATMRGG